MATLNHSESRRLYSWWWDSHISPKNSKWLQENLSDMDSKVKAMIRLIEEDAESFAQRAEMFYKKRPELMKLVEEFYRAYRALAERYDHATDALLQAHRKMAEAFPNEIPLEFSDELQFGYSSVDEEPDILEMNIVLFLPDDLQRVLPTSKITIKQLQDIFTGGELRKEFKWQEEEGRCSNCMLLLKENQDLKNKIIYESARADEAESEVHHLKENDSKASIKNEDAVSQCEEAKTRASYLENEISCMLEDIKKINHDDEINQTLEKTNQVLFSELEELKQRIIGQQKKLDVKEDELQKLIISLKDEQKQRAVCEIACHSNEKKLFEYQEKMKDAQLSKASLQEDMQKIRRDNGKMNEEKLSSAVKIINLQDEIISLRGQKGKLQAELNIQAEERASIQRELNCLKEDRNDLEKRYHALMEEIQIVNSSVQFLQMMITDLRDGNFELKETIKRQEDEKYHLLNIQQVRKLSEKNATLEITISDVNNDLEILRDKLRTLEDSYYYLHGRVSINQAEKAHLMSHVEAVSKNMEKISREKSLLENSLCDMNSEFDALQGKFKGLEESSQYLHDEKPTLPLEKVANVSQVESISQSLNNLERRYAALEGKHSNLQEKNSTLQQVEEIQELLNLEREVLNAFVMSSKRQLRGLVDQIQHLQLEGRQKEEELELEQINIMNAQIEIFVLQRCLCDMKEGNLILSIGSQKHQERIICSEKLILELEDECAAQENKLNSITEHNAKLKAWIHSLVKLLKIDLEHISFDDINDEILMQLVLSEIRHLLCTISEAQEEKQHLLHEKSVIVALLKLFGAYVEDLRAEKIALVRESKTRNEEFGLLKNKNDKCALMNEHLREKLQASKQREEALEAELDIYPQQLSGLQNELCSIQIKIDSMIEEKDELEKDNSFLISNVMALDCFSLTLQSLIAENGFELQSVSKRGNQLHKAQEDLDEEIRLMHKKITLLQTESSCINESIPELENCTSLLGEDEMNNTMQLAKEDTNNNYNYLELDVNVLKLEKEEDSARKRTDILHVHHENNMVEGKANGSLKHDEELRQKEKYLSSTMNSGTDGLNSCDVEIKLLTNGVSLTTCNLESLKAKVDELIKACQTFEHSLMIYMQTLKEEIRQRNFTINELKEKHNALDEENKGLKADLDAYLLLMRSLWDDISLLEEEVVSLGLAKHHTSTKNQKKKDIQMKSSTKITRERNENYGDVKMQGLRKLQDFHSKIEILKKVMMDSGRLLQLEKLDSTASMDSVWNGIKGVTSKDIQKQEKAKMNCEQIRRDSQLDTILNSSYNRNSVLDGRLKKAKSVEVFVDQVSELCRMTDGTCSSQSQKVSYVVPEDDIVVQHHNGVDEVSYSLLELVTEKELPVDKLVLSTKSESYQEWSRRVMQRLSSDCHRLLVLQACVRELQNGLEESEKLSHTISELEPKEQLKEAERSISKLIDINHKLTSKVEDFPAPTNSEKKDDGDGSRRQITDWARKVSEKIARMEIDMQKIQYNMMNAGEDSNMKQTQVFDKRSGILLKEYIYGRRNNRRKKKGSSGCIRPKGNGD